VSLPRCPRCRSAVNPSRFPRCIGCGADLKGTPLSGRKIHGKVLKQGQKDLGLALKLLTIVGILGAISFIPSCPNGVPMIISGSAAFVGTLPWLGRSISTNAGASCLNFLAILALSGMALLFGLGILLGFACAE
jgi:hypothetical protein